MRDITEELETYAKTINAWAEYVSRIWGDSLLNLTKALKEIGENNIISVDVYKIDRENYNTIHFKLPVPKTGYASDWDILRLLKPINVGDIVRLPSGKYYRRIRGKPYFREATEDDIAELVASQI